MGNCVCNKQQFQAESLIDDVQNAANDRERSLARETLLAKAGPIDETYDIVPQPNNKKKVGFEDENPQSQTETNNK